MFGIDKPHYHSSCWVWDWDKIFVWLVHHFSIVLFCTFLNVKKRYFEAPRRALNKFWYYDGWWSEYKLLVPESRSRTTKRWREGTEIRPHSLPRPKAASSEQTVNSRQSSLLRPGEETQTRAARCHHQAPARQSVAPGNKIIDICKTETGKLR